MYSWQSEMLAGDFLRKHRWIARCESGESAAIAKATHAVGRRGRSRLPHTMYCVMVQCNVASFCRLELHLCFKVDKPVEAYNG